MAGCAEGEWLDTESSRGEKNPYRGTPLTEGSDWAGVDNRDVIRPRRHWKGSRSEGQDGSAASERTGTYPRGRRKDAHSDKEGNQRIGTCPAAERWPWSPTQVKRNASCAGLRSDCPISAPGAHIEGCAPKGCGANPYSVG